ncbi:MAG: hypothetical protein F6J94_27395 [Moorea sp. SIO1F2]|uniref:hypothetical protein n=1 Tax=unclassified Moorena TaxID=2683338 RepID=UPI0013BADF97|nr:MULTISPECIES: hypothetical protein [unclassified Moorena]NEO20245.1 hypothetical protein [Moorena sp. SIO4A5]NEP22694.1 hypothetical protein [Moorena sp. SIO3I6]NEQ56337.1 hypothetical protein [Moorena sp. SIO4A1]NET85490.1 hypothetical protein [Moorena sp. SIO1F2]
MDLLHDAQQRAATRTHNSPVNWNAMLSKEPLRDAQQRAATRTHNSPVNWNVIP